MNLFYLDHDLDKCAEYHIDKHVGKMQLEACQLLCTALWVDKLFGFVPRKLNQEEYKELQNAKRMEPPIELRTFTRYLPTHANHPCAIWVRSSLENFWWTINYINALDEENIFRGNKPHSSRVVCNNLPDPKYLRNINITTRPQCMPDEFKSNDIVQSYRLFYMNDKKDFATWKVRGKPDWWNVEIN